MQIIASPQPTGYLTILRDDPQPLRRCVGADRRSARDRVAETLGLLAVTSGWLMAIAGAAILMTPDDAEQVRNGYCKIAMMGALMGGIGWISAWPASPRAS